MAPSNRLQKAQTGIGAQARDARVEYFCGRRVAANLIFFIFFAGAVKGLTGVLDVRTRGMGCIIVEIQAFSLWA
jgi:hypothetical protein